jgi:hypothetical protein
MDQGEERLDDAWLRTQLRRQARWILVRAVLIAAAATAATLLLP